MPLLGKIVVIKRNGTDGTEFPLTASCLFGRKLDCDIRIQLPQVSKEHCRIELNENKELILTNLSSVNPTLINGEILQQSERLKHRDLITIIDRSFRFEYPPAPTPKKKCLSTPGKGEAVKVLQDQQVRTTPGTTEKKKSEHTTDTCLKDGSNLPTCLDQSIGDQQNNTSMDSAVSPFSDLYNMVRRDLATKPVWKSASLSNTPLSRPPVDKQELEKVSRENDEPVTPKSTQRKRRSSTAKPVEVAQTENLPAQVKTVTPLVQVEQKRPSEGIGTPVSQKKTPQATPQEFTADQVAQQISFESPSTKIPKARRSSASQNLENQATSQNPSEPTEAEEAKAKQATRTSPRANAGKRLQFQDVLREVVATPTSECKGNDQASRKKHKHDDLPLPAPKRKRVSFGGQLSPELFDKRLPPNSPLRRGATPGRRSLGFSHEPHSLLRRASTIGLMGYQLEEDITESPAKKASSKRAASPANAPKAPSPAKTSKSPSPAKTLKAPSPAKTSKSPSPAKTLKAPSPAKTSKSPSPAKTMKAPSPAKTSKSPSPARTLKALSPAMNSPSPKAKTPSPKNSKTPKPSSNLSTIKTSRRLLNASAKSPSPSEESLLKTPTMRGRFSVSRISTPSPVPNEEKEAKEESVPVVQKPWECVTPRATLRRISLKELACKTPKSVLKSALHVVRSRRSGASRANLKVVSSWADIVKFGQAKLQTDGGAKKTATQRTAVKQPKVNKPKTPAHALKDHTSTGHADSPASIVVGKAYLRSAQLVGAAPKVVCNVALFKKDMKMDEDFTGVSDIFKTPANSRRKSAFTKNECPATPLIGCEMTEMSVINTPEEPGEMVVSPMSVVSTPKLGQYSSEAVTRLLQDEEMDDSFALSPSEVSPVLDMPSENQTVNEKAAPVQTPQHKPVLSECLTGVKRLMRTPKQKAEPIEDLRGKLLKTPKEPKLLQEESLEGVKELLHTPKQKGTPLEEDMGGLKMLIKTPKVANSSVACAVGLRRLIKTPKGKTEQEEDLTGVKRLMKTPKQKKQQVEEDLTGIEEMMKTPKQKSQLVEEKKRLAEEDLAIIQPMMKTPQEKKQLVVEDLTSIRQMMKMPKQKKQQVEELTGIDEMMKTPKQKSQFVEEKKQLVEEDLVVIRPMMKTPKQKKQPVEEDLTGIRPMMKTPKAKKRPVEEDLTGIREMMKTPKEKKRPVEEDLTGIRQMMKTPKEKKQPVEEDLTGIRQMMKTPKEKKRPVEEDLTGIRQMMKTPKEKKRPVEEDLTGIRQMMKMPKEKKRPVEEDLTGIRQMMKTPKEKKRPVEEDLTGIRQMMKTPKEKKQPVEEDLMGIRQMVKTSKQKNQPVEDLVGVKSLSQTTKVKGEPVENDFGIDNLMKTPKEKRDEAVMSSTIIVQLDSGVMPVEDASEESEEKENICPVEDMKNYAEAAEAKQSCQDVEEVTSCEVMTNADEDVQEAPLETVCTSETISMALEVTPSVASPNQEEQSNKSSPAAKTRHGTQLRMAPETQKSHGAGPEEVTSADSVKSVPSMRGRRGKSAIELIEAVPVQSPARKSTRGRIPKKQEASVSTEDEQVALKPRRGRKARHDEVLQVDSVTDLRASVEVEAFIKSPAPGRAKRGRKEKHESKTPQEPEAVPEALVEEVGVASESVEPQPSTVTTVPSKSSTRARRGRTRKEPTTLADVEESKDIKNPDAAVELKAVVLESSKIESAAENVDRFKSTTKTRRGRLTKKEMLKTSQVEESEPTPSVVESDVAVTLDVVKPKKPEGPTVKSAVQTEDPVKPDSKPRRGRATKKETLVTAQVEEIFKPSSDPEVLPEEHTQMSEVKSRRGRRVALNSQAVVNESNVEPHVVESQPKPEGTAVSSSLCGGNKQLKLQVEDIANGPAIVTTETTALTAEPVVKKIRGGRRTQQPKTQVSDDSQEEAQDNPSIVSETIQAPAARSARGKRTAAVKDEPEAPVKRGCRTAVPPVVRPGRGRKASAKSQPEVPEDTKIVVEPVEETSNETKVLGAVAEETPLAQADSEGVVSREVVPKRGRIAKKAKVSTKDTLVNEGEEAATEEESQLKSKKKDEPASKDEAETKQSVYPSVKGRKGRGAKRQEEPEKEKPEENVQPVRRGIAGASVVSNEVATCPKRGQKKKDMKVIAEETPDTESLPKRKRGKGIGAEAQTDTAVPVKGRRTVVNAAEETSEVKAKETSKKQEKPVRGRRKATQEDVPPQAEVSASEITTRRGARGQQKAETGGPSAPVRRTRRK